MKDLEYKTIDTLILGCTHYPLIRSMIGKIMGSNVTLVNPAYETAIELKRLLAAKNLACEPRGAGSAPEHEFYVSDAAEKFNEFANSILPYDIKTTKQINIEEY